MKAIYLHHPDLPYRVKLKYISYLKHYELVVQKKWFAFWYDVGEWMTVEESVFGLKNDPLPNPMVEEYRYGNKMEVWKAGTLDLEKRGLQLMVEYFCDERRKQLKKKYGK